MLGSGGIIGNRQQRGALHERSRRPEPGYIRQEPAGSDRWIRLLDQDNRLETHTTWSLEVVDHQNDSHVWDNQFETDSEARDAALAALNSEGAIAFMRGNNVVQFPRP